MFMAGDGKKKSSSEHTTQHFSCGEVMHGVNGVMKEREKD